MIKRLESQLWFMCDSLTDWLARNQGQLSQAEQKEIAELIHSYKAILNPELPNREDGILTGESDPASVIAP